jgi:hypothetical protein
MTAFYPGSKKQRKEYDDTQGTGQVKEDEDRFDLGSGRTYTVRGNSVELFGVGTLAAALNRKPVTVRKFETAGVIPVAPLVLPSHDQRGQRRLYTKEHIEGLRRIAEEEGILYPSDNGKWKSVESTAFSDRAVKLFKELNA